QSDRDLLTRELADYHNLTERFPVIDFWKMYPVKTQTTSILVKDTSFDYQGLSINYTIRDSVFYIGKHTDTVGTITIQTQQIRDHLIYSVKKNSGIIYNEDLNQFIDYAPTLGFSTSFVVPRTRESIL